MRQGVFDNISLKKKEVEFKVQTLKVQISNIFFLNKFKYSLLLLEKDLFADIEKKWWLMSCKGKGESIHTLITD